MEKRSPSVVVLGLIKNNGRFLLTKRNDGERNKGKWQVPGGGQEFGETLEEALKRELIEEVGLHVQVDGEPYIVEYIDDTWHGILFFYPCVLTDAKQEVVLNNEASQYGWFTLDEIRALDLLGASRSGIEALTEEI